MQFLGNFLSKQLSPPFSHVLSHSKEVNKRGGSSLVGASRLFITLIIWAPPSQPQTPVSVKLARTNDGLIVEFVGRCGRQAQYIVPERLLSKMIL